jgi:hypothetical protein
VSRLILYLLTTSQILGGIQAFALIDAQTAQTPFSALGTDGKFFFVLAYLLGLVGAVLILAGKRQGFALSAIHQLMLIPVILIPGGLHWVLEDFGYLAVILLSRAGVESGQLVVSLGLSGLTAALPPAPGTSYVGVNLLAVLFLVSLLLVRRDAGPLVGRPGTRLSFRRWLVHAIGLLQIATALVALPALLSGGRAVAMTAQLDTPLLLYAAGVNLAGLLGGLFLLVGWRAGFPLSITHQLLSAPLFVLVPQNAMYVFVSAVNFVVYVADAAGKYTFGVVGKAGLDLSMTLPADSPDAMIIGVNLFSLFCAWLLWSERRRQSMARTAEASEPALPRPQDLT